MANKIIPTIPKKSKKGPMDPVASSKLALVMFCSINIRLKTPRAPRSHSHHFTEVPLFLAQKYMVVTHTPSKKVISIQRKSEPVQAHCPIHEPYIFLPPYITLLI
jgi:hypothetical protein